MLNARQHKAAEAFVGQVIRLTADVKDYKHPLEAGTLGYVKSLTMNGHFNVDWGFDCPLPLLPHKDKYELAFPEYQQGKLTPVVYLCTASFWLRDRILGRCRVAIDAQTRKLLILQIERCSGEWHDGSPQDRKDLIEYLQGIQGLKERLYLNFKPAAEVPADWVSVASEVSVH